MRFILKNFAHLKINPIPKQTKSDYDYFFVGKVEKVGRSTLTGGKIEHLPVTMEMLN